MPEHLTHTSGQSEDQPTPLEQFHAEIKKLKTEEKTTAHFQDLIPEDLLEEDRRVYELFLNDTLSSNEFEAYRNDIQEQSSRTDFAAYIANKLQIRMLEKHLAQKEKED